jgi:hypothetical protein
MDNYSMLENGIANLLETARRQAAQSVNAILTATYWEIGRRIVEFEQGGQQRAEYGEQLLAKLSVVLTARFGRGFSERNLRQMRRFYLGWQIPQTVSAESGLIEIAKHFPLSWSHYVKPLSVAEPDARRFYETEAKRGGWSLRQLSRQINTLYYERTALSKNKAAMLTKGAAAKPEDAVTAEEEIKDPYVLEFLGLKDEYSETDLEDALNNLLNTVMAAEYRTILPDTEQLEAEIAKTRRMLQPAEDEDPAPNNA